jgi:hypothetical protein
VQQLGVVSGTASRDGVETVDAAAITMFEGVIVESGFAFNAIDVLTGRGQA